MTEFTVTFTADVTAIFHDEADVEETIMSDAFKEELRKSILHAIPYHHDVQLRNLRLFVGEEVEE